jgi:hypothetical protein
MKNVYSYIFAWCLSIQLLGQEAKVAFEFLNKTNFPIEFSLGNAQKPATIANLKTLEAGKKFAQQVPDSYMKPLQILFREKNKPDIAFLYEVRAKVGKKLYVRVLEKGKALSFEPQTLVYNNLDKESIKLIKTMGAQQVHEVDKPTAQVIQRVKSDLEQKSQTLDMAILMDEGDDNKQAKELKGLGAVGLALKKIIEQEIPFIMTYNLLKDLKQYAEGTYKKLLTDKWILLGTWTQRYEKIEYNYVIGLPKSYWKNLDITNFDNLKYIGLDQKSLVSLSQNELDVILNPTIFYEINLQSFKKIFTSNPFVRKNFYLHGHGNEGLVANLKAPVYVEFLEFLNTISTNILYIVSCYSGGVNIRDVYQKKAMDFTTPLNLNYFIYVGGVTDSVVYADTAKMDFKKFFEVTHTFFSPEGPKMKKPLETIGEALWGKGLESIPLVRFPGSVNYFKALNVDDTAEIITYAKARAGELEGKLGPSAKNAITVAKGKKAMLVYPPVVKANIKILADSIGDVQIISMIPGNAIHYFDSLDANLVLPDALNLSFMGVKGIREYFTARKIFFVKNLPTTFPTKGSNYMIYIDGPNKTLTQVHAETNKYKSDKNGYKLATYKLVDKEYKRDTKTISEQEAFDIIRKSIKDVGPWVQPVGDEYPENLIEAALQSSE